MSNTMSPVQPVISARHFSQSTEARCSDTTSQKARIGPKHSQLLQAHLQFITISKLVERLVAKRFTSHVNLHTLLPAQQSAYRPFHSAEIAVLSVHNDLVRAVDDCRVSAGTVRSQCSVRYGGPPGLAVRAF